MLAVFNLLELIAMEMMNAYNAAPCKKKIWTNLGSKFGKDKGKKAIIVRALHGLKSHDQVFSMHLDNGMQSLGYKSCQADHDPWFKVRTWKVDAGGTDSYYC